MSLCLVHIALKLFIPLLGVFELDEGLFFLSSELVDLLQESTVSLASLAVLLLCLCSLLDLILEVILNHVQLLSWELHYLIFKGLEESGCDNLTLDGCGLGLQYELTRKGLHV